MYQEEDILKELLTEDERQDLLFEFGIADVDAVDRVENNQQSSEFDVVPRSAAVNHPVRSPAAGGNGVCPTLQSSGASGSRHAAVSCGGRAGLIVGDSFVRRARFRPQVYEWEVTAVFCLCFAFCQRGRVLFCSVWSMFFS